MPGDNLKKVTQGQKLSIPAPTWNAFIDAANAHRNRGNSIGASARPKDTKNGIIYIKNDSGSDVDQFGILGLDDILISPTDNENEFRDKVTMSGVTPASTHKGKFGITLEPIAKDKIGRAVIAGISQVRLNVISESPEPRFAEVESGSLARLAVAKYGSAAILWRKGDTGEQWAVVRIGNPQIDALIPYGGGDENGWIGSRTHNIRITGGENPYGGVFREYDGDGGWTEGDTIEDVVNECEPFGAGVLSIGENYSCLMSYDSAGHPIIKEHPPRKICLNGESYRINKAVNPELADEYSEKDVPPARVMHFNQSVGRYNIDRTVVQFDLSDLPTSIRIDSAVLTWKVLGKRIDPASPYGYRVLLPAFEVAPVAGAPDWETITAAIEAASFTGDDLDAPGNYSADISAAIIETAHQQDKMLTVAFIGSIEENGSGDGRYDDIVLGDFQVCLLIQHDKSVKVTELIAYGGIAQKHDLETDVESYETRSDYPMQEWSKSNLATYQNYGWLRFEVPPEYSGRYLRTRLAVKINAATKGTPASIKNLGAYFLDEHIGEAITPTEANYLKLSNGSYFEIESPEGVKDGDVVVYDFGEQVIGTEEDPNAVEFSLYMLESYEGEVEVLPDESDGVEYWFDQSEAEGGYDDGNNTPSQNWDDALMLQTANRAWYRFQLPLAFAGETRNIKLRIKFGVVSFDEPDHVTHFGACLMSANAGAGGPAGTEAGWDSLANGQTENVPNPETIVSSQEIELDFGDHLVGEDGYIEFGVILEEMLLEGEDVRNETPISQIKVIVGTGPTDDNKNEFPYSDASLIFKATED